MIILRFVSVLCFFVVCCVYVFYCLFLGCFGTDVFVFFFKQKTAYEMRISDWSSDVCSSDLTTTLRSCAALSVAGEIGISNWHPARRPLVQMTLVAVLPLCGKLTSITSPISSGALLSTSMPVAEILWTSASISAPVEIGRAHVWTPVTNAQLVCRLLLEKKKIVTIHYCQQNKH